MTTGERKLQSNRGIAETTCRLILVRHASAQGKGRFLGQQDVPLTRAGRRELELLCEKCSRYPVKAIYASDLRRARQTAEAVARTLGLQIEIRPVLREMHFGEWEGLPWDQVAQRFPELAALWLERFPQQAIPGGERLNDFKRRIRKAVGEIVEANRGKCALVVSHAGVIRFTLGRVLGLPARNLFRLAQDSCALNVIDFAGTGAVVRCING